VIGFTLPENRTRVYSLAGRYRRRKQAFGLSCCGIVTKKVRNILLANGSVSDACVALNVSGNYASVCRSEEKECLLIEDMNPLITQCRWAETASILKTICIRSAVLTQLTSVTE